MHDLALTVSYHLSSSTFETFPPPQNYPFINEYIICSLHCRTVLQIRFVSVPSVFSTSCSWWWWC